ncbi:MAG: hypothetical protein CMH56_12460 [Myxococcales bacterium]|mgnify:CR=1 FL=1|nr:hypothetical protein [Myxococcales bacterium]
MHFNKTNHFYLQHALGIHLCPLHRPQFAFFEGENNKDVFENNTLASGPDMQDGLVSWLAHLGKSLDWMLPPAQRDHPLLHRIREGHAQRRRFARRLAQSPLAPESTWRLAHTLQNHFHTTERWAILDDDHHLAWTLRQNHVEAHGFVVETSREQAKDDGLSNHESHTFWGQNWLAGFHQNNETYPGVVVDTLHVDNMLHFALLRAQEILEPNGICGVILHPWQRDFLESLAPLLNFELIQSQNESILRYGPHFVPHEILWDVHFYRAKSSGSSLDPQKTYSRKAAKNLEPSSHLVGAGVLDQLVPSGNPPLEKALKLLQKGGKIKVLNQETLDDNTFWALPNGGHMALHHAAPFQRLQVDFSPWRPRLLTQFTTAMLTYFERRSPYMELP